MRPAAGKPSFARGGKLLVNTAPPMGLTDTSGNFVDGANSGQPGGEGRFTIQARARGVVRSGN